MLVVRTLTSLFLIIRAGVLACILVAAAAPMAMAKEKSPSILRDAEVEGIIRSYADPLFRAAGIPPASITLRILNAPSLNAFVTTGNRMFIHSGLLMKAETPGQLIGVIAHETGHIAGGHMVRLHDKIEDTSMGMLGSLALGALAGLASGRADVGMAAMSLGQNVLARDFFAFSRTQENSADAFALKVLDETGQSAQGLLEFFELLEGQELLSAAQQDPYVRTHPLTIDRIDTVRHHVERSSVPADTPTQQQLAHDRMVAKLFAFLQPQSRTLNRYGPDNESVAARYARAIAFFRRGQLDKSLPLIDGLLAEYPNDPYFHELKGQMLVENGRVKQAIPSYARAVELAPDAPLIAISYGHALVESGDAAVLEKAVGVLERALAQDPASPFGWRLLGTAQGRLGNEPQAAYALAEYALRAGDYERALYHVGKAETGIPQSDPAWLRLQDIRQEAERRREEKAQR